VSAPPRDLRREAFLRALHAPLAQPVPAPPQRAPSPWPPPPAAETLGFDGGGGGGGGGAFPGGDGLASSAPQPPFGDAAPAATAPGDAALAATAAAARGASWAARSAYAGQPFAAATQAQASAAPGQPFAAGGASTGRRSSGTSAGAASAAAEPRAAWPDARATSARAAVLAAGTVVPALLLTAVNSDLPGPLMAQVSRDVYDFHQRAVVLARGTRLLGRYDHQVAVGQRRLLVAWTRLQLLDGTLVELPGLPGADPAGAAGLPARVQNHLLRVFGDAVLLSVLSAGAELAQPPPRSLVAAPSAGSVTSAAAGQQLSEVGLQLLRRDLGIQPTLQLPAGTPFTVFVNADLPLAVPGGRGPESGLGETAEPAAAGAGLPGDRP
jgi:type IV secretory pathway VirB10-like protein